MEQILDYVVQGSSVQLADRAFVDELGVDSLAAVKR
jgi:hypothetical protein